MIEVLVGALSRLLFAQIPDLNAELASTLIGKLVLLVSTPDEFWVQFNIAVAELAEGKTPSIIGEVEQLAGDLFGQAVQP